MCRFRASDLVLENVPITYRHRIELSDYGWSPNRRSAVHKGVIIRFVAETQMASAESLFDRTDMYYMVAQEGMSNPYADTGLPAPQKIAKPISKPVYLGEKPTVMDTIARIALVVGLSSGLALFIIQLHKYARMVTDTSSDRVRLSPKR